MSKWIKGETHNGQAGQDVFVMKCLEEKVSGYFLEIGSNHYSFHSNTYFLETKYGWSGLLVEYDPQFESQYKLHRPNSKYIINDATKIDFKAALDNLKAPLNIDYLQIDLDVNNKSTIQTLENLNTQIIDKYKFATVTFEHDIYTGDFFNTRARSREIFAKRGYTLVFPDVQWCPGQPFEDWYAHPDLTDKNYIDKIKTDASLLYTDVLNKL